MHLPYTGELLLEHPKPAAALNAASLWAMHGHYEKWQRFSQQGVRSVIVSSGRAETESQIYDSVISSLTSISC